MLLTSICRKENSTSDQLPRMSIGRWGLSYTLRRAELDELVLCSILLASGAFHAAAPHELQTSIVNDAPVHALSVRRSGDQMSINRWRLSYTSRRGELVELVSHSMQLDQVHFMPLPSIAVWYRKSMLFHTHSARFLSLQSIPTRRILILTEEEDIIERDDRLS